MKAGLKTQAPKWRLLIHDWSKLTPKEWVAYREAFYGVAPVGLIEHYKGMKVVYTGDEAKKKWQEHVDRQFKYAWLHHQHLNPHHWQHWLLRQDNGRTLAMDMPEHFIREMVADWVGAGYAINGKVEVQDWYEKNKQHMILSPDTKELVEELLGLFPTGTSL